MLFVDALPRWPACERRRQTVVTVPRARQHAGCQARHPPPSLPPKTLLPSAAHGQQFYYKNMGKLLVKPGERVTGGQPVGTVGAYQGKNAHIHMAVKLGTPCDILEACSPPDNRGCA